MVVLGNAERIWHNLAAQTVSKKLHALDGRQRALAAGSLEIALSFE